MLIEFQTTGKNFLYQFREQLKIASMPLTDDPMDNSGRTQVINRVVIGNDTQLRSDEGANFEIRVAPSGALRLVPGKQMQIVQPVTIELVYLDDLVKWGDVPSPVTSVQIWLIFDVSMTVFGGAANLSIAYSEVFPPDAGIDSRLKAAHVTGMGTRGRGERRRRVLVLPTLNGVIERFMRTLKEQCIYLHRFQSLAEARRLIADFLHCYNTAWLIERLGDRTPAQARADAQRRAA